MTPSPKSLEESLALSARLGAVPSTTVLTDEYATSVDRPADERAKILTAAVASWERLAKEYPSKIEVARGMTRQLAAVAALLGDPAPTVSPGPGAAAQGEEPPHWTAKMILLPRYPNAAIPRRLIGSVSVDVDLDDSGVVRAATIRSSDDALFNQAALAAAMLTRLDPPRSATEAKFTIVEHFPPVVTGKWVR